MDARGAYVHVGGTARGGVRGAGDDAGAGGMEQPAGPRALGAGAGAHVVLCGTAAAL